MRFAVRREALLRWLWLALGLVNLGLALYLAMYGIRGMGGANGTGEGLLGGLVICFAVPCALTARPFLVWFRRAKTPGAPAPHTLSVVGALFLAAVPWVPVTYVLIRSS